jgi:CRISPR-associated protein Csm1
LDGQEKKQVKERLTAFAIEALAGWSGQPPGPLLDGLPKKARQQLQPYRKIVGEDRSPLPSGSPSLSVFSKVYAKDGREPPQHHWRPRALSLELTDEAQDRETLWNGFRAEWERLTEIKLEESLRFEAFTHLLHRWAWAVPCSYGEPGVSLYDEFRALSALAHVSDDEIEPDDEFLLVGGDVPGIQDFVYTITSKGAAKGLRGRSFFVQLLGDAVVRRLLADLGLPETNVIYAAGGNFMLLAPAGTGETVRRVRKGVNARLVEAIQGDTALVLETMPVKAADLFAPDRFPGVREDLAAQIARAKRRPLRELADDWATLFEPKGRGSELSCTVCRIEVDEHNSKELEPTGETPEAEASPPRICYLCDSLGKLARDIRHEELWMMVEDTAAMLDTEVQTQDEWADLLARMTGFRYGFSGTPPKARDTVLAINQPDFVRAGAHGFRLLANVTPTTTDQDIQYLRKEAKWEEKDLPQEGDVRSFALLARAAAQAGAIERVGVLRMDVDGLGRTFSQGVPDLTLPKLSALSGALERFFGGYLNTLVREPGGNDLYVTYAGGDDLFIVGAWHHLPDLAQAISDAFKTFTGDNPALSLSGGLTLEGARFPLYRAAERAGQAEHKAKSYTRPDDRGKDAFCFLGTVVGWEDWDLVRRQKDELLWLIGARENPEKKTRLPRSLLQIVQSIHGLYHTGLRDARRRVRQENRERPQKKPLPKSQMFLGRWTWMKVYSLTRLAQRSKKRVPDAPERIKELQKQIMRPATVRYSGLAARWAEYQTRKEGR